MTGRFLNVAPADRPASSWDLSLRDTAKPGSAERRYFWYGIVALFLYFALSSNVITMLGVDITAPGGNPLTKLHPGTDVVVIGAAVLLLTSRAARARLWLESPTLAVFLVIIPLCAAYSMYWTGFSGSAVYVESYLAAGLLAVVLEAGSDRQLRGLGYMLLALVLLNVSIGLVEGITETHLFPFYINGVELDNWRGEFRSLAFYSHPLTASIVTSMGVFLLFGMRLRFWQLGSILAMLLVGLLAFGGRTALSVTLLMIVGAALHKLVRGLATRRLEAGFVGVLVFGLVVLPALGLVLVSETTLGERIINSLYFDDSAQVRTAQWQVLDFLTTKNWMFGISPSDLTVLKVQIGLASNTTDIENFWLLMFLNLGVIGFVPFLGGFVAFLVHIGRRAGAAPAWMLLVAAIVIDSSSDSLGVRSADLCFITGFVTSIGGFRRYSFVPVAVQSRATRFVRFRGYLVSSLDVGRGMQLVPAGAGRGLSPVPVRKGLIA